MSLRAAISDHHWLGDKQGRWWRVGVSHPERRKEGRGGSQGETGDASRMMCSTCGFRRIPHVVQEPGAESGIHGGGWLGSAQFLVTMQKPNRQSLLLSSTSPAVHAALSEGGGPSERQEGPRAPRAAGELGRWNPNFLSGVADAERGQASPRRSGPQAPDTHQEGRTRTPRVELWLQGPRVLQGGLCVCRR